MLIPPSLLSQAILLFTSCCCWCPRYCRIPSELSNWQLNRLSRKNYRTILQRSHDRTCPSHNSINLFLPAITQRKTISTPSPPLIEDISRLIHMISITIPTMPPPPHFFNYTHMNSRKITKQKKSKQDHSIKYNSLNKIPTQDSPIIKQVHFKKLYIITYSKKK
jgi:hypothetical protein